MSKEIKNQENEPKVAEQVLKINSEEVQEMAKNFVERLKKQDKANEIYGKFLQSCGLATFEFEPCEIEGKEHEVCKLGEGKVLLQSDDYPSYYGGAYIDDFGDLVIHVVGNVNECQAEIEKVVEQKDGYVVKQARFRYKDFMKLKEYLDELEMNEKQKEVFSNITSYGPDDRNNLFLVEMNVLDEAHIAEFRAHISDSEMIVFRQGEFGVEDHNPGRRITRNNLNAESTLAFRARRGSTNGFVISGHVAENGGGNGTQMRANGPNSMILGSVTIWRVSGGTDAAFCAQTLTFTMSNRLAQNNNIILSSATSTVAVGTQVRMAGQASNIQLGTVREINATSTISGRPTLTGTRANYSRQSGDSGAPVYTTVGTQNRVVGVHARSLSGDGFFVNIAPVVSALGISLY